MSEKETRCAAIQILCQQLANLEFNNGYSVEVFLANFETILETIKSLTHDEIPSSVKKTILRNQLREEPAVWAWEESRLHEFAEMDYEQFKKALIQKYGNGA